MANAINANTIYIDSTGNITTPGTSGIKVTQIWITPTAVTSVLILKDTGTGTPKKVHFQWDADAQTQRLLNDTDEIVFPTGINVDTLTDCEVTLLYKQLGAS